MNYDDSSDRSPGDFILFFLAFAGFILGTAGVIVNSIGTAVTGGVLMVLSILPFRWRTAPGD